MVAFVSPVIALIEAGHVCQWRPTRFTGGQPSHEVPSNCARCGVLFPCPAILTARAVARRTWRPT